MQVKDLSYLYPFLYILGAAALGYLIYIIWKYARDLKESPRELWYVSLSQLMEYVAYTLMNTTFVLFLSADVGMSDTGAGTYIGVWSTGITLTMLVVGALVDAVGVKKILVAGTILALISRLFLFVTNNIYLLTFLGFLPQAISIALLGPVISVAIKRYTKKDTSAMGFALFYTLMNIGFAIGGWLFDFIREVFGEYGTVDIPLLGEISTYRTILLVSFLLTIPIYILIKIMRKGIDLNDDGTLEITPEAEKAEGNTLVVALTTIKNAFMDAFKILMKVWRQPPFWKLMGLLAILLGVNYVFLHLHYTFPKYGIRVLGEGAKVGTLYGVTNPVVVIFLVPFVAALTRKVSSYLMITIGTFISAFSVFIVTLPEEFFMPLVDTVFGRLLWQEWLGVSPSTDPKVLALYIGIFLFIALFTLGEAIWSPRLMEYTAKIAPKGQEGSYLSLSMLPRFATKPLVAIMSGGLLSSYVPMVDKVDAAGQAVVNEAGKTVQVVGDLSNHSMVWVWIGAIAVISPIGMLIFRKFVSGEAEDAHEESGNKV